MYIATGALNHIHICFALLNYFKMLSNQPNYANLQYLIKPSVVGIFAPLKI